MGYALVLALLVTLLVPTVGSAATLSVGPGGYATIQSAVAEALPGDTVSVAPGTYRGQVVITKPLRLVGSGAGSSIIEPSGDVIYADNGLVLVTGPVTVDVSGFTVDGKAPGFNVEGGITYLAGARGSIHHNTVQRVHFGAYGQGIRLNGASPDVYENTVTDVSEVGICVAAAPAGAASSTVLVRDNVVNGPVRYGIRTCDTATIAGNTVSHTDMDGIRIDQYSASSAVDRVILRDNQISYTKFSGIQVSASSGHLIQGNILNHANYYGFDGTGDWDYGGIKIEQDSPDNEVIENRLTDGIIAIHTWADRTYIARNVIADYGLTYADSKLDLASYRIFRNAAVMVGNNYVPWVFDPEGVVVEENVMDRNAWGLFHSDKLSNLVQAQRNWWGSPQGPQDDTGTVELPAPDPSGLDSCANRLPAGFLGAAVSERVSYYPWYADQELNLLVEFVPGFPDVLDSHPYAAAIRDLAGRGVISGRRDGTFGPADPVLRAQFAKMAVQSLDLAVVEGGAPVPFWDVEKPTTNLYPDDYVAVAALNGLIQGYGDGRFGPYDDITRAQLLTIVVRMAEGFNPQALATPSSGWEGILPGSDPTHGASIRTAEYSGLLAGINLSTFSLWQPATRGEVAQILWNLEEK